MRSPSAQILETALALQRAPGERFRLRERPLPAGVIHLLEIAAASPQALAPVAAELGEDESVLLEAARFYLEQVLFADPEADAYRVLGLAPDAPHEAIRTHHRWLQRWLHPDRAQAGDATVFATRVNQAFAQLRSPESRHAYDVRLAEARLAGATAPLAPETLRRWERSGEPEYSHVGKRSRWLLAAAALSCMVLAVLIVRNPQNAAAWEEERATGAEPGQAADVHDAPAIEDRDLGILVDALSAPHEPRNDEREQDAFNAESPASVPAEMPLAPLPTAFVAGETMAPGKPADSPDATAPLAAKTGAEPAIVPRMLAAHALRQSLPTTAATPPKADAIAESAPPAGPDSAQAAPPGVPAAVSSDRRRLAEQRASEVIGYLGARPGIFPMWNDPAVEEAAARLRSALNANSGSLQLEEAGWIVNADSASLEAMYRCRTTSNGPCEGRLHVDLVWREGLWLVRRVSLAPSS